MSIPAMRAPATRSFTAPRRLVWLLWLVLLLPIAQVTAVRHALSHTGLDAAGDTSGKQAPHQTQCELCLTAAAVDGGGLPTALPALPLPLARHALPQAVWVGVWIASPLRAYRSRAPPFASR
jgi:hypothetical protein